MLSLSANNVECVGGCVDEWVSANCNVKAKTETKDHKFILNHTSKKTKYEKVLNEYSVRVWTGFIWLRTGTSGGLI
jgi:hypothetical protein